MPLSGLRTRRDVLRAGAFTLAASALPARALGAAVPSGPARTVVVLWMAGGVTQFESFDPKPEAPEAIRGTLGTIATALPGVRFAEVLPGLAKLADRLAVIRSYSHDNNDHFLSQAYALSGRKVGMDQILTEPNVGSVVSALQGPAHGLPGYIAVPGAARPGPPPHNLFVGGWLGEKHAPFATGGHPRELDFHEAFLARTGPPPETFEEDLHPPDLALDPSLSPDRLGRRMRLRQRLDDQLRRLERGDRLDAQDENLRAAHRLLQSPAIRRAFALDTEPDRVRDAYGRTKIGRRCLLARRLVEAGARFLLVDYGYDPDYGNLWDNHGVAVQRQPHISELARAAYHLAGTDRACAALIADLEARGLLESTLVVFLTEFGRAPQINPQGGRDHWGMAGSIFFAGGGTKGGQVLGATDRQGAYPTTDGYSPADVAATIYRAIGIDPTTQITDRLGRPMAVLPQGRAIPGLL